MSKQSKRNTQKARQKSKSSMVQRRKERKNSRGNVDPADWAGFDAELLQELVAIVTKLGVNITFGYTRDGGAYYLSYYDGQENDWSVWRPTEDVDRMLLDEISFWKDDMPE